MPRAAASPASTSARARNATTASCSSPASGAIASSSAMRLERPAEVADRRSRAGCPPARVRSRVEPARDRRPVERLRLGLESGGVAGAGPLEQRERVIVGRSAASASMRRITSSSPSSSAVAQTASTRCLPVRLSTHLLLSTATEGRADSSAPPVGSALDYSASAFFVRAWRGLLRRRASASARPSSALDARRRPRPRPPRRSLRPRRRPRPRPRPRPRSTAVKLAQVDGVAVRRR